ncbi:MAG TPA: hypothetical protein VF584_07260 [Longimicrobium sp.]|jgi:hypothetical protein
MPFSIRSSTLLLAVGVAILTKSAAAQSTIVTLPPPSGEAPGRAFSMRSASPVSASAVLQAVMEPAPDSGAVLGYAVIIRGPTNWYRRPTRWRELRNEGGSEPADSESSAEAWTVGEREYTIRYNRVMSSLTLFGHTVDLRVSRVVFVTLGAAPTDSAIVVQGPAVHFRLPERTAFAQAFLDAVPAAKAFASDPPQEVVVREMSMNTKPRVPWQLHGIRGTSTSGGAYMPARTAADFPAHALP